MSQSAPSTLLVGYRHHEERAKVVANYPPKSWFFRQIAELLWGPNNKRKQFVWNPWAEQMNEVCHAHPLTGKPHPHTALNGCAACVAGHTKLLNPITGEEPTIQELCERQIAPVVMTLNGPAIAGIPFLKGQDDLYEVVLVNGKRFTATGEHQVLTPFGFRLVASMRDGEHLLAYEAALPASTSGSALSIRRLDAGCYSQRVEDSLEHCSVCCRPCGEPLRVAINNGQVPVPLLADVQRYKGCASLDSDDWGNKSSRSHPYQQPALLSSYDFFGQPHSPETCGFLHFVGEILSRESQWFQPHGRFHLDRLPQRSSLTPTPCYAYRPNCGDELFAWPIVSIEPSEVLEIRKVGFGNYYDLHVPIHHHYFAEGTIHHNSGKSSFGAIYAIINWMCDPVHTLVLCTSTDIKASRQRIWGQIKEYYQAVPGLPGKMVDSQALIVTTDDRGNKVSDRCGISLIAGEKKKEQEAIGKIIGAHNKRVFMIADELPELTQALLATAMSNLVVNDFFQMVAMGNFKSRYDPFGTFCEPKGGDWDVISLSDYEWETKYGYCVRFSGMRSPNILECRTGKNAYPGIFARKHYEEIKAMRGEHSAEFWRMVHSFEPPIGLDNAIFSEADLQAGLAYRDVIWLGQPTMVAGLDPGYTNGGDRSVLRIAKWGMSTEGLNVLHFEKRILLQEDVRKKNRPRNFQIVEQFRDQCIAHGVEPQHAGFDSTGAGGPFGDIVAELWSPKVMRVDFSGALSDLQVSVNDPRTAKQRYDRKVSAIWYDAFEFVKYKQFRGVTPDMAREMKARTYDTIKGADGLKVAVEPKDKMKDRLGFSPDDAEAGMICLQVARERLGALAGGQSSGFARANQDWQEQVKRAQQMYDPNSMYQPVEG